MPPSMGSILPDWLIDVHVMFMLLPVTLHMAQFFLDSSLQKEGKKFDLLSEEQRNIADQECNKINEVSTTFNIEESSFIGRIQFQSVLSSSHYLTLKVLQSCRSEWRSGTYLHGKLRCGHHSPQLLAPSSLFLCLLVHLLRFCWSPTSKHYYMYSLDKKLVNSISSSKIFNALQSVWKPNMATNSSLPTQNIALVGNYVSLGSTL